MTANVIAPRPLTTAWGAGSSAVGTALRSDTSIPRPARRCHGCGAPTVRLSGVCRTCAAWNSYIVGVEHSALLVEMARSASERQRQASIRRFADDGVRS